MAKPDLGYAIGLPPEKAVEYFRAKGDAVTWDWYDRWQEAHAQAFTVAKATQMDVLRDIRGMVDKALADGITLRKFQDDLFPTLLRKGWWGREIVESPKGGLKEVQLGSPSRLETIYRTNTHTAYNRGRYLEQIEDVEDRPYWQYTALLDSLTRPSHAKLHGLVFRWDDPFWDSFYPPCGFNCRCGVRNLTPDQVAARNLKVSSSEGRLSEVEVEIAKGVRVNVTRYQGDGFAIAPDPGWSYNPGKTDWTPALPKYEPPVVQEYQAAVSRRGLAKDFPVRSPSDISRLIREVDKDAPGLFHRGFDRVEVVSTDSYFMATNTRGRIYLADHVFRSSGGMNPARDLTAALNKVGRDQDLTFNEEYSIESLWHEILHNRAKGASLDLHPRSFANVMMETLNQFVARHTYPEFLASLGGHEAHGAAILERGYGYGTWVRNFRTIFKAAGIDENEALALLRPISYDSNWKDLPYEVANALAELYGNKKSTPQFLKAFHLLDKTKDVDFDRTIRGFLLE